MELEFHLKSGSATALFLKYVFLEGYNQDKNFFRADPQDVIDIKEFKKVRF